MELGNKELKNEMRNARREMRDKKQEKQNAGQIEKGVMELGLDEKEVVKGVKGKKGKEVVEEKKGVEEIEDRKRKISFSKSPYVFGGIALFSILGVIFFSSRSNTPAVYTNVDAVSLIRKVNEENRKQTQQIVNQLAEQIKALTAAIEKQQKTQIQQQAKKVSGKQKSQIAKLEAKLKAIEEKAKLKRELQMQKALLKQYIEETRRREVPSVSLAVEVEKVEKPAVKKKSYLHRVYIPTGSVAAGVTMHSIPAPVERGVLPLPPVLIKLTGSAHTANGFSVPLDECYMIGKAQGDWNFIGGKEYARAEIQLDKLICVLGNGKVIEKKVNAYVIDRESGMNGLKGKKLDISGEQIAKFTAINTLSSFWSGLAKSYTETTTTNDGYTFEKVTKPAKYALFSALSKSWDKFTKFYEQRLSKIYPVVITPANKELEVVFLSGVDLGVTDEELQRWGI
jgi:hypothetical protein